MGLPTLPKLTEKTELWDVVTSDFWELFNILKLSVDWLALPPTQLSGTPARTILSSESLSEQSR